MRNFTVGPVQSSNAVLAIGAEQVPYFRTAEFSETMFENERLVKKFAKATEDSKVVFMTCSGSGGMETAIINCLNKNDKALVINGGSFGERFVELLTLHEIPFTEIKLEHGKALKPEHLAPYEGKGYTAFLMQKHETATNTGIMITGSQKALACAPGIAVMILAPSALKRVEENKCCCQYLDLKLALKNMERGQTPWTPAVGILRQINVRLKEIEAIGGADAEIARCADLAKYFRNKLVEYNLPFEIVSESLSNAVTPLHPTTQSAYEIFLKIKDEYGMWICPNGGNMKDTVFRVGHIGYLHKEDYDKLIDAFLDLRDKKFI